MNNKLTESVIVLLYSTLLIFFVMYLFSCFSIAVREVNLYTVAITAFFGAVGGGVGSYILIMVDNAKQTDRKKISILLSLLQDFEGNISKIGNYNNLYRGYISLCSTEHLHYFVDDKDFVNRFHELNMLYHEYEEILKSYISLQHASSRLTLLAAFVSSNDLLSKTKEMIKTINSILN